MIPPSYTSDEGVLQNWYRYAAEQEGSVDQFLRLLRDRLGHSLEKQQQDFGLSDDQFTRLRGFRAPRPESFASDAQYIAEACEASNTFAVVQALITAKSLMYPIAGSQNKQIYRAAFDPDQTLEIIPDEDIDNKSANSKETD